MAEKIKLLFTIITVAILPFFTNYSIIEITVNDFIDSYLSVSVYVALTLILLEAIERLFNFKLDNFNKRNPQYQVIISGFLGSLPGCGGAIVVLTQFCENNVSFGSVIAALTATMGDAAFLLLSKEPLTGVTIIAISLLTGIISGYIVDLIHGKDFLKVKKEKIKIEKNPQIEQSKLSSFELLWLIILIPGIILGITKTVFYGIEENYLWLNKAMNIIGFAGAGLSIILFLGQNNLITENVHSQKSHIRKVISDTNFISFWVICSLLFYSYITYLFNINLESLFNSHKIILPLIAILVGFIPGCGPQIVVTTLYINGLISLSAQIGNAISNDGDALFPAIAISPKVALLATVYSAIPALILSYSYMVIFE